MVLHQEWKKKSILQHEEWVRARMNFPGWCFGECLGFSCATALIYTVFTETQPRFPVLPAPVKVSFISLNLSVFLFAISISQLWHLNFHECLVSIQNHFIVTSFFVIVPLLLSHLLCQRKHSVTVFLSLAYFTQQDHSQVHPFLCKWHSFILLDS